MTSNQIGDQIELKAKEILEREGFIVHRAQRVFVKPKHGKPFMRSNDVFKCFDLVAISSFQKPRFIQVTTAKNLAERRKKVDLNLPISIQGCDIEVWAWHKGRGKMYFVQFYRKGMEWVRGKDIYQRNGR